MKIRTVTPQDAEALTQLLNDVIGAGGTTALETPLTPAEFSDWFISGSNALGCQVAEVDGLLVGFQSLSADDALPPDTADIATFSRLSPKVRGVGSALFPATLAAAKSHGFKHINATIRADNVGGLAYYHKMGFRDYDRLPQVPLSDGTPIDRIKKRFSL
ncbi:L-amino acid N-acyltransferase YncA [Serratia marcescens]|uniref:L-amino acid N-acyltransferase YncA n=1 Tax=Serratia marcescens TaxID=615 RepID=A0AA46QAG9_SERMA|nr:GNAT family N-acetyltransferase [Serratia marcescens]TQI84296.1 L-amino acid N-acyltransferase YncA [Serratia marcescens]HEJ7118643.1 GNAT family N-acetyltransferase [Serratia marcescens]